MTRFSTLGGAHRWTGTTIWRTWGGLTIAAGLSVLLGACEGGQVDTESQVAKRPVAADTVAVRARALAAPVPGERVVLPAGVYSVRSVPNPGLLIGGIPFSAPTLEPVPVDAPLPVNTTLKFVPATSALGDAAIGCGYLTLRSPINSGGVVSIMLSAGGGTSLWWSGLSDEYDTPGPSVTVCPEVAPNGRGLYLRWLSMPDMVMRIDGNSLILSAPEQNPEFIASASFDVVPVPAFVANQPPEVMFNDWDRLADVRTGTKEGEPLSLIVDASDPEGRLVRVELIDELEQKVLAAATTPPFMPTWLPLAGTYKLRYRAWDAQGAWTDSSQLDEVDVAPPAAPPILRVALSEPAAGVPVPAGAVRLSAKAVDTRGLPTTVEFYDGATLLGRGTQVAGTSTWSITATLGVGQHEISAQATAPDGVRIASAAVQLTAIAPPWSLQAPASAPVGNAVSLAAVNTSGLGAATARTEFYEGTTLIGANVQAPWTQAWTPTTEGQRPLFVRVVDVHGAVSNSATVMVAVGSTNAPPTTALLTPANGTVVAPGTTVTLTTNPGDVDGWITRVDFYDGTTLIGSRTEQPWTLDWTPSIGVHVIKAWAFDNDGAISATTPAAAATLSVKGADNQRPSATLLAPAADTTAPAGAPLLIRAGPGDVDGWITRVEFYDGGTLIGTRTQDPWSFEWTGAAGTHELSVKVFDNEGASSFSASVRVTLVP